MKRIIAFTVGLFCAAALLLPFAPASYAESGDYIEALMLTGNPCFEDIEAAGDDKKITVPPDEEYLDEYLWAFIDAPYGEGAFVYQDPCTDHFRQQGVVFHRTRVAVLAVHNGYYCLIRYYNENDKVRTGWIPRKFISEEYPEKGFYSGYPRQIGAYWKKDREFGELSEDYFPGTMVKYVNLGDPPKILTMKVRYKITGKNGVDDPTGTYSLYLLHDGNWCESSVFNVNEINEAVDIDVYCNSPEEITGIAVLPLDKNKQGAEFELYAVDILV